MIREAKQIIIPTLNNEDFVPLTALSSRQEQCLIGLQHLNEATANELALYLFSKGKLPYFSRNFVHPRLKELKDLGKVVEKGKKLDTITNKMCQVYSLT